MTRREDGPSAPSLAEGATSKAPKRFWPKHKTEAVLRLLRGEDLDLVSREIGVTAAPLSEWRDIFLAGGADAFKKRPAKEEAEITRLNAKIGEQAMENELLREKIVRMEKGNPLARRRSRK